jgi:thioester reductase-like protein
MDQHAYAEMAGRIDAIVHCGADVNFIRSYESLKSSTVNGTTEVLRLASTGSAKPLHYVSSMVVFGSRDYVDSGVVTEDDPLAAGRQVPIGYFQTKWVAERMVRMARDRGVPVAIYRPGPIGGDLDSGECKLDDLLPMLIRGCVQLRVAPSMGTLMIDFTPVDYLSQAIVHLACRPDSLGKAFNFATPEALTWNSIVDILREYGYPLERLPYNKWLEALGSAPAGNALPQMLPFFEKLEENLMKPPTLDTRNLREGLDGAQLPSWTPRDALRKYLDYFVRCGFLPAPGEHTR